MLPPTGWCLTTTGVIDTGASGRCTVDTCCWADGHIEGSRQVVLPCREESAGGGDGDAALCLQVAGGGDEERKKLAIGCVHDGVDTGAPNRCMTHREGKRFRRADIAGDARESGVEGEDAEHGRAW